MVISVLTNNELPFFQFSDNCCNNGFGHGLFSIYNKVRVCVVCIVDIVQLPLSSGVLPVAHGRKFHDIFQASPFAVYDTAGSGLSGSFKINFEVSFGKHLEALRDEVRNNPAPGRKCDFICQEINREINTIGSKNQILEVGQAVISAKDALENIREQTRNIE